MSTLLDQLQRALGETYVLERELGRGGSATVYLAHDVKHRRSVAVKVLHQELAAAFGLERFRREIETTANLRHPHILPLFDSGEASGTLYYVMPLVAGESLRAQLDRAGKLPVADALRLTREIADALSYAHAQGIVHRDVKPENVLVEDGRAVVTDFGIARATSAGGTQQRLTAIGMSLGTPHYMSPEQAFGEESVDARSDQYSLACMLYEMLAGDPPFTGANAMAIVVKHMHQPAPRLADACPGLEHGIAEAIDRALAKDPDDRFPSVAAFLAALTASERAPAAASTTQHELSLGVVPLTVIGRDDALAGMADELTDVVANGLALFPYLTVVRGESARAEYALTGRVRKSGATVRVSVQLVRRATQEQLWGESYDRIVVDDDVFAAIDDVADHVIAVVADPYGVLVRAFTSVVNETPLASLTPYEAVLRYYHFHQRPAPDTHLRARDALEQAAEQAPRDADVWACLTYLYLDEDRHAFNPRPDALARALAAGRRAVDADPTHANAHAALAEAHFFRGDVGGFRASADRAVALNRRDGATVAMLGNLLAASGSGERGVALAQRAMACNPYHPGWYLFGTFFTHFKRGAFAEALATAERINMPGYLFAVLTLAVAHAAVGHAREAESARQELLALVPTIDRDGQALIEKWLRFDPELLEAFLRGMARAGIGTPADARSNAAPTSSASVAVLPFTNMSADPDAEFFGDGIAADILNELAKLSGLRVIARASSFALKGERADVRKVGAQLGARFVLDGSVRKAGQRLRLTVQLVDAESGVTAWSERYDRDLVDVFAVQDEITAAVRDALSARLLGVGPVRGGEAPPIDAATYELFLRGRHLVEWLESADRGVALLEQVIRRAPGFAPAYAELATAHMFRVFYGFVAPRDGWPLVRSLGEQAAALDAGCAQAQFILAETAFFWEWDWAKAEPLYQRALALDPNDADTLATYGMYLASTRRFDEAVRLSSKALALDPLNPIQLVRAMICTYLARRFDETLAICDRAIELLPEFPESYRWQGVALLAQGRVGASVAALETAVRISGRNVWAVFDLGNALVAAGAGEAARTLARELVDRSCTEPLSDWALTLEPLAQHPPDVAGVLTVLERAVREQRSFWCVMFDVEPLVDQWRGEPRFQALLREIGIPTVRGHDTLGIAHPDVLPSSSTNDVVATAAPIRSLAVLPLENLSRDPAQEFFSDGLTEALITELAKVGALKVISRTSVMRYKTTRASLPEIARTLGVDAIIEGSVLRAGDEVRISAQLIHAATDTHLWAESYDRELTRVLSLMSEVARTIAGEVRAKLTPQEEARLTRRTRVDPAAHEAYLKGRHLWNQRGAGLAKSIAFFERALAVDPDYAPAHAGLADAHALLGFYGYVAPTDAMPKAKAAARRALALDDTLAAAHACLGYVATLYDWDWEGAGRHFDRALALNPSYDAAHYWRASWLSALGRFDEAIAETWRGLEYDPLSVYMQTHLGVTLMHAGRHADAAERFQSTLAWAPGFWFARQGLAIALRALGRTSDALVEVRAAVEHSNRQPWPLATLGQLSALVGDTATTRSILAELEGRRETGFVPAEHIATLHALLGDADTAYRWLERAFDERSPLAPYLARPVFGSWMFNALKNDSRVPRLADRLHLPM